jgi:transposase-like protein
LVNNNYEAFALNKISREKKQKPDTQKRKWAKFTYIGKETRFITKLFKNTDVKVTFTTDNTIERCLAMKHGTDHSKYDKSGIYQPTCPNCKMKYTGQTGSPFKTRLQEHFRDFKYGNNKSKFTQHLLENKHSFSPMEDILDTVHVTNKGKMMDTLERYYIYKERKSNNQINDKLTVKPNPIFETLIHEAPHRGHPNS